MSRKPHEKNKKQKQYLTPLPDPRSQKLPVFVINLDRRSDRWDSITSELDKVGIEAIRISAIDARDMTARDIPNPFLSVGEWACTLSHCKALRNFLDTDRPAALILEDDIELAPDLPTVLDGVEWWPASTRLISMENAQPKLRYMGRERGRTPSNRTLRPIAHTSMGSASYLIDRKAALMVLDASRTETVPMDVLLFNLWYSRTARRLKPMQIMPSMTRQKFECLESDVMPYQKSAHLDRIHRLYKKIPGLPYRIYILFLWCFGLVRREMVAFKDNP